MSENLNTSNVENDNPINNSSNNRILKHEKHLIEIRRARVLELWSQGWSQPRIADEVHVVQSAIHEDISFLKQQAREQIRSFVTEQLPSTVAKARVTLDLITQKLWMTVAQAERDEDEKTKMQALSAIQSAEMQKIEIVSNTGIVDSVISAAEGQQFRSTPKEMISETGSNSGSGIEGAEEDISDDKSPANLVCKQPAPITRARAIPVDGDDN